MDLWTVVLKTYAWINGSGEHPYRVRAPDQATAIERAKEAHRSKHPRSTADIKVHEVVRWAVSL